jgi:hypothetical protein
MPEIINDEHKTIDYNHNYDDLSTNNMRIASLFDYLLIIFIYLFTISVFIISWFFPQKIIKYIRQAKARNKDLFPFLPKQIHEIIFLYDNEKLSIWFARFVASVGFGMLIFAAYVFVINNSFLNP